eukprot:14495438-Alexandrium_andersonii.AAC.1
MAHILVEYRRLLQQEPVPDPDEERKHGWASHALPLPLRGEVHAGRPCDVQESPLALADLLVNQAVT